LDFFVYYNLNKIFSKDNSCSQEGKFKLLLNPAMSENPQRLKNEKVYVQNFIADYEFGDSLLTIIVIALALLGITCNDIMCKGFDSHHGHHLPTAICNTECYN
jgi:hypothetical protein